MGIPPAPGGAEAVVTGLSLVSPAEKHGQSLCFLTFFFSFENIPLVQSVLYHEAGRK